MSTSDIKSACDQFNKAMSLDYEFYTDKRYNDIRRNKLILLSHCIGFDDNELPKMEKIKKQIVEKLERGCLNKSIENAIFYDIRAIWSNDKFIEIYHDICYRVASNLDSNSIIKSNYITKKLINGDVDPLKVAFMTSKELTPHKDKKITERIIQRNNIERNIKYSTLYFCRKCKNNKTITERRYNRSLDEGVNLTIRCTYCGFSWNG